MIRQQTLMSYNGSTTTFTPPMATGSTLLSQFTHWARIWMSSSNTSQRISRKRKTLDDSNPTKPRETDIRSRSNHYDYQLEQLPQPQSQPQPQSHRHPTNSISRVSNSSVVLYRATCQKLRPNHCHLALGDIIHVRRLWDILEQHVYGNISSTSHYLPPSQRLPFNPDRPGSLFSPKRSRSRRCSPLASGQQQPKRPSFASSTIVYSVSKENQHIHILPTELTSRLSLPCVSQAVVSQQPGLDDDDDDDDVPLGALRFS